MDEYGFDAQLALILESEFKPDYKAAVGVVQCGDRWLLGLAKTDDDRNRTWCFPGGHIKRHEEVKHAAVREVYEETGIKCRAVGEPFHLPQRNAVAFVHCRAAARQEFKNNSEFTALGFFTKREMKTLKLYKNVTKLLDRIH